MLMLDIEPGEAIDIAGVAVIKCLWRSRDEASIVVRVATPDRATVARLQYRRTTAVSPTVSVSFDGFRGRHCHIGVEAPREIRVTRIARQPREERAS